MSEERLIERHTVADAWALSTYGRCDVRCDYCITSAQGVSTPRRPVARMAAAVGEALDSLAVVDRLFVGPFSDAYPSPEAELGATRAALEAVVERSLTFFLITKGITVLRDVDLFRAVDAQVMVSLNTLDQDQLDGHEPGADTASARLAAVQALHDRGVRTQLQISPWIPGVSDVEALRARVDDAIPIVVTPLRLPPWLHRASRRYGLTQADVNERYQREFERIGPQVNLRWSAAPPSDGRPVFITDQVGRRRPADVGAAPPAPDPGPVRSWQTGWDG